MENRLSALETRLAELESRLAFQDDLVAALNDQVSRQEQELLRLWDANRVLRDRVQAAGQSNIRDLSEEVPPPHY